MLDLSAISAKVKGAMKALLDGGKPHSDYSLVIETDFETEKLNTRRPTKIDFTDPGMDSDFMEGDDLQNSQNIQEEIEAAIRESCKKEFKCQVILPDNLSSRVSQDIVRMSVLEPCGVHGCAIYITLQDKGKSQLLATIFGNPSSPPTFEIHLTLKEDNRSWKKLHKAYLTIKGCIFNSLWTAAPKILRSSYQLEKRRLYRSGRNVENVH